MVASVDEIAIRGEFRRLSGWGKFAREMAFALQELGIRVVLDDMVGTPPEEILAMPEMQRVGGMIGDPGLLDLVHITSPALTRIEPLRRNYMFTQFEADRAPVQWLPNSRLADMVIVPSLSSRQAWVAEGIPPSRICQCPQGVDAERYATADPLASVSDQMVRGRRVGDRHARFLNVSDVYGGFRKNLGALLATWIHETLAEDDAILMLKWSYWAGDDAVLGYLTRLVGGIERHLGKSSENAAPIVLLSGHYPEAAMPGLYAACSHYVSVSTGEGWDLPMLEAGAAGLRLIAPGHSGYRAYLNDTIATLLPFTVAPSFTTGWPAPVQSDYAGSRWWEPDLDAAAAAMREAIAGRDRYKPTAQATIRREFSWRSAAEQLLRIVEMGPIA